MATPKCMFRGCREVPAFAVQRLWQIPGKAPFALLHCCVIHKPGNGRCHPENAVLAAKVAEVRQRGQSFYEVTPLGN